MKYVYVVSIIIILSIFSCIDDKSRLEHVSDNTEEKVLSAKPALRHVVLFNFKDSTEMTTLREIENAFAALPSKIPSIRDFEWGVNNSTEGLDKGLSHCFLVTFGSEEDRDIYLPHPAHQEFVAMIGPYVEDVTVVDYWIK
jgi:isopropylmalate/homocitrate/citramalate synthase